MKKIQFYLGVFATLLVLNACVKNQDIGNYNYDEIDNALNKLTVRLSTPSHPVPVGSDTLSVAIFRGDSLHIFAEIISKEGHPTFNPDEYSYEWIAYNRATPLPSDQDLKVELGNEKDLRMLAQIPPSSYWLHYNVTHKATGMRYTTKASLSVQDLGTIGWLVMCADENGMMRIDVRTIINDTVRYYQDVPKLLGYDYPEVKDPIKFYRILTRKEFDLDVFSPDGDGFYLLGKSKSFRVRRSDLSYNPVWSLKEHFITDASDTLVALNMDGDGILDGSNVMVGNDHNLYLYNMRLRYFFGDLANTWNRGATTFRTSPHVVAYHPSGSPIGWIIFNEDEKSFLRMFPTLRPGTSGSLAQLPEGNIRPYTNTGLDLVWMGIQIQHSPWRIYAILKDPQTGRPWLMQAVYSDAMEQLIFQEINATDIDKASFFAVGGAFPGRVYYAVNDKIYQYIIPGTSGVEVTELVLDLQGHEITMMRFDDPVLKKGNDLLVGSFDQSSGYGTFTRYSPQEYGNMKLTLDSDSIPISYGPNNPVPCYFGKIVDVYNKDK